MRPFFFRKINQDKYVGGRGATTGVARTEKRRGGRIACTAMTCELGAVLDLSATGLRIHAKKKPVEEVGAERELKLTAEEETTTVRARCMWVRVDDACEFDMGWEFVGVDASARRRLLEMTTTAQANEGLTRGWSVMEWWKRAG